MVSLSSQQLNENLRTYLSGAIERAEHAIVHGRPLADRFPARLQRAAILFDIGEASPAQALAETLVLPEGPVLAIFEDVTGSGKTEAALILAHRLISHGKADGIYLALPTMATANAMYERLAQSLPRLFSQKPKPSLVLAHGRRGLHEGFLDSVIEGPPCRARGTVSGGASRNPTSSAACADWIADDRRKAFLATVGAGTIDQAILGVLPSNIRRCASGASPTASSSSTKRMPTMLICRRTEETLLEFQAHCGCTIVLSATLPLGSAQPLVAAFRRGLAIRKREILLACRKRLSLGYHRRAPKGSRRRQWPCAPVLLRSVRPCD